MGAKGKTRASEGADDETFGMLFAAEVFSFEELHSEIEKILITDCLVEHWTYPQIQPKLIEEAKNRGFCECQTPERPRVRPDRRPCKNREAPARGLPVLYVLLFTRRKRR